MKLENEDDIEKAYENFVRFLNSVETKHYAVIDRPTIEMLQAIFKILNSTSVTLRDVNERQTLGKWLN